MRLDYRPNLLIYRDIDESASDEKKKSSMQLISDVRLVSAARESPELSGI